MLDQLGDRLTVVDGRDGKVIGQVEGMPGGTHGIAISHAAGLGYTDDGEAGEAADRLWQEIVQALKQAAPDQPASGRRNGRTRSGL